MGRVFLSIVSKGSLLSALQSALGGLLQRRKERFTSFLGWLTSLAFVDAARAHCIYVLVGTAFGSSYVDHVRFCFGKPLAELEEMLSALGGASNVA